MDTTLGQAATSPDGIPSGPLITLKDISWLMYLYPVRWLATHARASFRGNQAVLLALCRAIAGRERRRVQARLERVPIGLLSRPAKDIARDNLDHAVRRVLDDLNMQSLVADRSLKVTINGREHLERAVREKRGAILLSGHFFAARLAKRVLAASGYPVMSVRHFSPPDDNMGRLWGRRLQQEYIEFLSSVIVDEVDTTDPACTMKILQRLREGGLVNIHADSRFSSQVMDLPFLGAPGTFALGFLRIAEIAGCPLIPFRFLGDSRRLEISFDEPIRPVPGDRQATLRAIVEDLERQILKNPEQWEIWVRW